MQRWIRTGVALWVRLIGRNHKLFHRHTLCDALTKELCRAWLSWLWQGAVETRTESHIPIRYWLKQDLVRSDKESQYVNERIWDRNIGCIVSGLGPGTRVIQILKFGWIANRVRYLESISWDYSWDGCPAQWWEDNIEAQGLLNPRAIWRRWWSARHHHLDSWRL